MNLEKYDLPAPDDPHINRLTPEFSAIVDWLSLNRHVAIHSNSCKIL